MTTKTAIHSSISTSASPYKSTTFTCIGLSLYVLSGALQPILITQVKAAGLGDPTCQLYMFFYYLGPALVAMHLYLIQRRQQQKQKLNQNTSPNTPGHENPSSLASSSSSMKRFLIYAAMFIATIDIIAQAMNYTGSTLAGPTVFAILYSSVGIWTALYSRIFFRRKLSWGQWLGVFLAFGGLILVILPSHQHVSKEQQQEDEEMTIPNHGISEITTQDIDSDLTATPTTRHMFDTTQIEPSPLHSSTTHHYHHHNHSHEDSSSSSTMTKMTPDEILEQESLVSLGTILIFFGSMIHAFTYILSEAIMNVDVYLSSSSSLSFLFPSFRNKTNNTTTSITTTAEVSTGIHHGSTQPHHHRRHHSIPSSSSALIISSQSSSTESLHQNDTLFHPSDVDKKEEGDTKYASTLPIPSSSSHPSSSPSSHEVDQNNISILENAFIQGCTALTLNALWQILYTLPHFQQLIYQPMMIHQTSLSQALFLLLSLSTFNAIHSLTFYYTLKHVQGGATTAAVMKGLQAVMVFAFTWILDLQTTGTNLFSWSKCLSLVLVVTGVVLYGSLSHSSLSSTTNKNTVSNSVDSEMGEHKLEMGKNDENDTEDDETFYDAEKEHLNGKTVRYGATSTIHV